MSKFRVLVCGGGIAGPALAFWLARSGAEVTIVERSPSLRTTGQTIDIRGAAVEVVRRMGLEETVREKTTQEAGISFVDKGNKTWASFPVDPSGKNPSFTSEFEIVRGDLVRVLYDATKDNVEYIFDNDVKHLDNTADVVHVDFTNNSLRRTFDIVVIADGMGSHTRGLAFSTTTSPVHSLGQYCSYFSIPWQDSDGTFSRWYNAPGRRCILVRPEHGTTTRAFLSVINTSPRLKDHTKLSVTEQKQLNRDFFDDAGWEAPRILDGMDAADDFYMQHVAQVKMDHWSVGRIAVVGDAAYCPSPISGMGTSVAIVGAYVLAGELARCGREDHEESFAAYERIMRPFVERVQKLPPGAPAIANPETQWGITFFYSVLGLVSWSGIGKLFGSFGFGSPPADAVELPRYDL